VSTNCIIGLDSANLAFQQGQHSHEVGRFYSQLFVKIIERLVKRKSLGFFCWLKRSDHFFIFSSVRALFDIHV